MPDIKLESAGLHITIDAFVEDPSIFNKEALSDLFTNLATNLGMQILIGPKFVEIPIDPEILKQSQKTREFHDEGGITGFCIISKSHMTLHAWPLQKFFSMDIFSCGDFDPQVAIDLVINELKTTLIDVNVIGRKKPIFQKPSVYCITNKINGKRYIGKSKDPTARWGIHVWLAAHPNHNAFSVIHKAIAKYGRDNFIFQLLEICETDEEAYQKEKEWVAFFKTNDRKCGYNLTKGGIGFLGLSPEAKEKRALNKIGKCSGTKSPMFGKFGSEHPAFGSRRSEEFKVRLSEMRRGEGNPMFGHPMSIEIKAAKSKAWKDNNPRQPRFTKKDIEQILSFREKGLTQRELSEKFNVSQATISMMLTGKYKTKK